MKKNTRLLALIVCIAICITSLVSKAQNNNLYPQQYGKPFKGVPDRQDVTLYQVNTRSFSNSGDFKGVILRLDSIKALGINVIYLMPIYPVGILKATNSPYATKDYNAVGSEFGSLDDLRALVNGAHQKKMAVIIDWVGNHTSWDNAWISNKGWYQQDSTGNIKYPEGWRDVAQLNFKNKEMRLTMIHAMKAWVLKANIDGFRCDYADGPPVDFWKQAIDTLKTVTSHKLLMLAEGSRDANFAAGFDYNFGFKFYENLKRIYSNGKSARSIDTIDRQEYAGAGDGQGMVRYITNHDVNSSDGTPLDLFGGRGGAMAAFVVAAYTKGIPMIYNGQEIGTPFRLVFPFTNSHIDWLHPDTGIRSEYKKIIAFRNNNKAIRRGLMKSYSSDDVCAFTKTDGIEQVLILSNLRDKSLIYNIPADLSHGSWKDAFNGRKMVLNTQVQLQPYTYIVVKRQLNQ